MDKKYANGQWINTGEWSKHNGPWTIGGGSQVNDAFTLRFGPGLQHVALGESTRYSVTPVSNGYGGAVSLSVPVAPGVVASVSPPVVNVGQTAAVQLTASPSASLGPVPLIMTATAGTRKVTTVATVEMEGKEVPIKTLSVDLAGPGNTAWEASSAADPFNGTWAMSWKDLSLGGTIRLSVYDGGWKESVGSNGLPILTGIKDDANLSWDPVQKRFVLVVVRADGAIMYGHQEGSGWKLDCPVALSPSATSSWDYPSVAVTADGRIAVGATEISIAPVAFRVVISPPAGSGCPVWGSALDALVGGNAAGARIIAAGNNLHAFGMSIDFTGTLQSVRRTAFDQDANPQRWGPVVDTLFSLASTEVAKLYLDGAPNTFAGRLFSVAGRANGDWVLAFQRANSVSGVSFNNAWLCRSWQSNPRCAAVEPAAEHQIMPEVALADDGYWVTFFRYSSNSAPLLNAGLLYFSSSGSIRSGVLSDPSSGAPILIDTMSWTDANAAGYFRCGVDPQVLAQGCRALGDYNTMASTIDSVLLLPYVGSPGAFQQSGFIQDPPMAQDQAEKDSVLVKRGAGR